MHNANPTGNGDLGPLWHQFPAGEAQHLEKHASGHGIEPEPLELVKFSGAGVHVDTDGSESAGGCRRGMGCDGRGREKCWGSSTAENSNSGSDDLIYPASARGL